MAAAIKHMASSFAKLEKFEGMDFKRWKKKMHFMLSSMSVVYVLTTPMPEDGGENPTVEQVRKRDKWDNDDYIYRGLILNGISDSFFDIYQNVETSKELWDTLEAKYMAEDASSKKFLVRFTMNFLEQYNELLGILRRFTQHKINMDESIQVSCIIDKLTHSWKDFKHTLKHLKEELTLIELGSHLRIGESLRVQDSDKPKGNNVVVPLVVNMVERNNSSRYNDNKGLILTHSWKDFKHTLKHLKEELTLIELGSHLRIEESLRVQDSDKPKGNNVDSGATMHVCKDRCWFKTYESLNDGYILHMENELTALMHGRGCVDLRVWGCRVAVRLPDPKLKTLGERVVSERITDEIVQQFELRKSKRHRTPKDFRPEFQLYLIEGTRDEVSNHNFYCFNVEDDPKTFDEAMKSRDVAFWKEAINDEIDSIMGNNTWLLTDLPPGCKPLSFLNRELEEEVYMNQPLGFIMHGNENKVDLTKEFLSSRFSLKDMGEADVILGIRIKHESNVSTPLDTCEKLMPNRGLDVSQLEYSRVIGYLMYAMTYTRLDIAFAMGKLNWYTLVIVLEGYTDARWISNTEDNSSTSGWVFLLGGAAGKKAEWLKNLLLEIPSWVKPIAPISIRCNGAATLAKACSQMYNGKSRHLGVRHSMICELITNRVVSIEFVRSQQNLADHLTKGLARDLVIKTAEGM
nr:zinc finger, CCHC-type [Tanacetum cinerariifolium]